MILYIHISVGLWLLMYSLFNDVRLVCTYMQEDQLKGNAFRSMCSSNRKFFPYFYTSNMVALNLSVILKVNIKYVN